MMGLKRGERQIQRTRTALEVAFKELVREKRYNEVTVGEIADRANVGRVTFYRHFQSKADILVSLHEDAFSQLSMGLASAADWLADEPPAPLVALLETYQQRGAPSAPTSPTLNRDFDYLSRRIRKSLAQQFEDNLHRSFGADASTIPFNLLAESISGTYYGMIMSWVMAEHRTITAYDIARYIHRLTRSSICEAFEL